MRKIILVGALFLSGLCVHAQSGVGKVSLMPQVGISVASTSSGATKFKAGWATGVTAEYQLSRPLALSVGALFSMEGGKIKETGTKLFLDYVNVPILANYYVIRGLAVKAGVQVGFQVFGKEKVDGEFIPLEVSKNKVALAIPVGLSYEWAKLVLDARYNIGLTDMLDVPGVAYRSKDFMITLGYRFSL